MPPTLPDTARPAGHALPTAVVLASRSPRRRRLLEWLGVPFVSAAVDTPEELESPLASNPAALAISLAAEKADAARAEGLGREALVLCFDTIVVLDGTVLGKPLDEADAWRMLRALSGRAHQVVTGAAVLAPDLTAPHTFAVTTDVAMRDLDDAAIEAWMARGTYLGCAGAYNIEAQVAEVGLSDCYQNVAGLPLCHLYAALICDDALATWLPSVPASPVPECDRQLCRRCRLGPHAIAGEVR